MKVPSKIFNDPIHGHIELSALSVKIMDTPQFQRLRDISQLGGVYYVFPGAASKRFEHSIGVSYLARTFIERILEKQPELGIAQSDVLCIEIAGLCHDLGHGPFSHLFDGKVLPFVNGNHDFVHEFASVGIFDILIAENNLMTEFRKYGLNEDDVHFIKELILGDPEEAPPGFVWKGRGNKTFLYDIVANKRNGIDVDKFDYFARDCFVLGLTKSFDALRLMKFARVFPVTRNSSNMKGINLSQDDSGFIGTNLFVEELVDSPTAAALYSSNGHGAEKSSEGKVTTLEICFDIKEAWNIFELFHTRYALHKRAYQHRVSNALEEMLSEVLILADPHILIPGTNGVMRHMSECPNDLQAYWRLTEYVQFMIQHSTSPELQPARTALNRIRTRDLFTLAGELLLAPEHRDMLKSAACGKHLGEWIKERLVELLVQEKVNATDAGVTSEDASELLSLKESDIFCTIVKIGYGKGNKNPVSDLTTFYMLDKEDLAVTSAALTTAAAITTASTVGDSQLTFDSLVDGGMTSIDSLSVVSEQMKRRKWKVGVVPQDSVSRLTPREFEETYIRIFARHKTQVKIVKSLFAQWCESRQILSQTTTPRKRVRPEI